MQCTFHICTLYIAHFAHCIFCRLHILHITHFAPCIFCTLHILHLAYFAHCTLRFIKKGLCWYLTFPLKSHSNCFLLRSETHFDFQNSHHQHGPEKEPQWMTHVCLQCSSMFIQCLSSSSWWWWEKEVDSAGPLNDACLPSNVFLHLLLLYFHPFHFHHHQNLNRRHHHLGLSQINFPFYYLSLTKLVNVCFFWSGLYLFND